MADIYYKGKPLAFYTRQDAILANPFVKADTKRMGQLLDLAKATAVSCGICSEKPYEGEEGKEENGVVQINRHNGIVLACKRHPILGYVLSTYREDSAGALWQALSTCRRLFGQASRQMAQALGCPCPGYEERVGKYLDEMRERYGQ